MKRSLYLMFSVLVLASMMLAACAPAATPEPTAVPAPTDVPATVAPAATDVLRARDSGNQVRDRCASIAAIGTCTAHTVKLPAEASGTMLVFRVFDRVSFALILDETTPLAVGDLVTNP